MIIQVWKYRETVWYFERKERLAMSRVRRRWVHYSESWWEWYLDDFQGSNVWKSAPAPYWHLWLNKTFYATLVPFNKFSRAEVRRSLIWSTQLQHISSSLISSCARGPHPSSPPALRAGHHHVCFRSKLQRWQCNNTARVWSGSIALPVYSVQ